MLYTVGFAKEESDENILGEECGKLYGCTDATIDC